MHAQNDLRDFFKCIRMPIEAFDLLHSHLEPSLRKNEEMASLRGGIISPKARLHATIRYLGGGKMHDICRCLNISWTEVYNIAHDVCEAIITCGILRIRFPQTEEECATASLEFRSISSNDAVKNCALVFDGYLEHIHQPSKKMVGNQRVYYSGHYCKFGLNIQAACDAISRFNFFGIAGPGNMNDKVALHQCPLGEFIENLPPGYCAIGDAAYEPTERVTPIFYGVNRSDPLCDNFNYFASQLRIRIEMAVGLMQMKWHFLQEPRQATRYLPTYTMAIAHLHNFVVNYRLDQGATTTEIWQEEQNDNRDSFVSVLPSQPEDSEGNPLLYDENGTAARHRFARGHSHLRHTIALSIQQRGLHRPEASCNQRREQDEE